MKPSWIIVHHSLTPRDLAIGQTEASIERNHKSRGFPISSLGWHVGYQYMIYGDGTVKQYRREDEEGAHCKEQMMNFRSVGICLIGNFDKEMPSDAQKYALQSLLRRLVATYAIPLAQIVPHRHFASYKSCYGRNLADNWASVLAGGIIDSMITKDNANGILFALDGKTDHGQDSQALADAGNSGDQTAVNLILARYVKKAVVDALQKLLNQLINSQ
jgi:hypothetical protein